MARYRVEHTGEERARWILRLIAEKSVELGYVESISHVAVGDLLKRTTQITRKPKMSRSSSALG